MTVLTQEGEFIMVSECFLCANENPFSLVYNTCLSGTFTSTISFLCDDCVHERPPQRNICVHAKSISLNLIFWWVELSCQITGVENRRSQNRFSVSGPSNWERNILRLYFTYDKEGLSHGKQTWNRFGAYTAYNCICFVSTNFWCFEKFLVPLWEDDREKR